MAEKSRGAVVKKLIILLFIIIFFFQPASALSPPNQSNESPPDDSQIHSDLEELCIDLNDIDGDNMYWEIRQGGNVLENGTPFSYPTHTYNFTDSINNTARWECSPTPLRMTSETEFISTEYTNISNVDSLNVTTNCTSYDWSHHHFIFNISEDPYDITNIAVNWHGYAGGLTTGAKPKWYWDASMYIKKGNWGLAVDSTELYEGTPHLEWINWSTASHGYIPSTGLLEIAIENTYASRPGIVLTDYIEVVITYVTGGDPNGTYCTDNVSFWNNDTCEQWWTWSVYVNDGHHNSYTTDYMFQNPPCILSGYIYPQDNATNVCPCCDAICVGVGALYDRVNLTVYGREHGQSCWHIWDIYTNITNGSYCFCMDSITPSQRTHCVYRCNTTQTMPTTDTWFNVTWDDGHGIRILSSDMENITFLEHGYYTIKYWTAIKDNSVNPLGNLMAVSLFCNGVELNDSYREMTFANRQFQKHLAGNVHDEFFSGDVIQLRYIGDNTNQVLETNGTWSSDTINAYIYIEKTGMEEYHPLRYNTTYQWYVYVEDCTNSSLNLTSSTYSFTTAASPDDCLCESEDFAQKDFIIGLVGVIGIIGLLGYFSMRKKRGG